MKRVFYLAYLTKEKAVRDILIASIISFYMFMVTPGWVYLEHQSVVAVLVALTK